MGVGGQRHAPAAEPWVDFRACPDKCGKSRPHLDSIPGPSSP